MAKTIFEIADAYVEEAARLDPYDATMEGIAGYDDRATDFSPEGTLARAEHDRKTVRELEEAVPSGESERLASDVMLERLRAKLALFEADEHLSDLNVLHPPSGAIRQVFDQMPRQSEADWQAIARRLHLVPEALAGYRQTLDQGLSAGQTATARMATAVAEQAETWSGREGGPPSFFHALVEDPARGSGAGAALTRDLAEGADRAAAAYAEFASYLRTAYAPRAGKVDGFGADRYALHSRLYNGTALDLVETYEWGWQELYRIEDEMRKTAHAISAGATPLEAVAILNTDPDRAIRGGDAYRDWLQEIHDGALAAMDGIHFDIPERINSIEVRIPPPGGSLAPYYTPPAEDFSWPGRTWWPLGSSESFPRWDRVSIAYHEGVPGHHLQVGAVRCFKDTLSRYQQILFVSGHGEGWALYAERLMGELGYLEDPEYYLGMLSSQALRAVRIVVDIGLHLGLKLPASEGENAGKVWEHDLAVQFAAERSLQTREFMQSEVLRYLGWPGQAISYKVGERVWLETRDEVRKARGASFELKEFHTAALALGPVGLEVLRSELTKSLSRG